MRACVRAFVCVRVAGCVVNVCACCSDGDCLYFVQHLYILGVWFCFTFDKHSIGHRAPNY